MQKKAVVFNDFHVGSSQGMLPPDFLDTQGNVHKQNPAQSYLWQNFQRTLKRLSPQKIDAVIFNGDLDDGAPGKGSDKNQDSTLHRSEDRIEASIKVLEEIKNTWPNAAWYFVRGTPNHERPADVATVAYRLLGKTHKIHDSLMLRFGKALIRFHHEVSFTAALTKSAPLERELIYQYLAEAMNGREPVHCEVRAHCHYFAYVGRRDRLAIVCPAWQLQTPFMTKNSDVKNIPDLGCVVLHVDDSLVDQGACPVSFSEYLFPYPQPEIVEIEEGEVANG